MKLSKDGLFNLMRLTQKGMDENGGRAKVSKVVWPLVDAAPEALVARTRNEDGSGTTCLTDEAYTVLKWDQYFADLPKHNTP
jgi:hypothetical protein